MNDYEELKKDEFVGFADLYLRKSEPIERFDIKIYTKLIQLDSKLGTTASEQLYTCLRHTTRWDIIKVIIFALNIQ